MYCANCYIIEIEIILFSTISVIVHNIKFKNYLGSNVLHNI